MGALLAIHHCVDIKIATKHENKYHNEVIHHHLEEIIAKLEAVMFGWFWRWAAWCSARE